METTDGKAKSKACGGKADALTAGGKRVAMECGFVKRVKPGTPKEQVRELQMAPENHPCNA